MKSFKVEIHSSVIEWMLNTEFLAFSVKTVTCCDSSFNIFKGTC